MRRTASKPAVAALVMATFLAAVVVPVSVIYLMFRQDAKDNQTRCAVMGLVIQLTENSKRSTEATLSSPTASPDQKMAATRNRAAIIRYRGTAEDLLRHPTGIHCKT